MRVASKRGQGGTLGLIATTTIIANMITTITSITTITTTTITIIIMRRLQEKEVKVEYRVKP